MMVDEGRNPLELDAVVRRFADSAAALANVRDQLRVLTELREAEEGTKQSLQDSAGEVARFSVEAASVLKGLEDALAKVAEILNVGGDLIGGAELKLITERVGANAESIARVEGHVDTLESRLGEFTATVVCLKASIGQDMDGLKTDLQDILAAAKTPKIVKRLF